MVRSSNGREAILVGCEQNPEKIFKLRWENESSLEWVLMKQELKYPKTGTIAMLIPDELTNCKDNSVDADGKYDGRDFFFK